MNFNYQMRYSRTGRARFISHLDTLSCLMRAIRRSGAKLSFSQGMRPKPILSLAMPLGVGVEGEDEICDFSLQQRAPLTELAKKISRELPQGMALKSVGPCFDRSKSAARVESCGYRIEFAAGAGDSARASAENIADDLATEPPSVSAADPPDENAPGLASALDKFNSAAELVVLRRRPKGDKEVDIKKYVEEVQMIEDGSGITFEMKVTPEGTARPDEIIEALSAFAGRKIKPARIVRTEIRLREEEQLKPPRPGRPPYRGRRR